MTLPTPPTQVLDDSELLSLMVSDAAEAPPEYCATNYWRVYEKRFLPELYRSGLHDFRRRTNSVLSSFGAADLEPPRGRVDLRRSPLAAWSSNRYWQSALFRVSRALRSLPISGGIPYHDYRTLAFDVAELFGQSVGARPLRSVGMSRAGNPEDAFDVDGNTYSMLFLNYYIRYAYCTQFCDFASLGTIVELGSGGGKQIEVLKKLYPDLTILAFDIPPQLYVCEQYLKTVFPELVVSYRDGRLLNSLQELPRGSIALLASWQFPLMATTETDLFWNEGSFQEMEPDVVANYLRFVDTHAGAAFLAEAEHGQHIAAQPGHPGVLERTTFDDYRQGLASLELVDFSPTRQAAGIDGGCHNSFWIRPGWRHARTAPHVADE